MKAGIKFCGGCNPRYDRGSQTTGLKERLKEVQWVSGDDSQVCDFWLIICGCSRACVSTESLSAKQQILVIKSRMDFSRAEEIIRKAAADEKKQKRKRKRLKVGMTASMKKQITKTDVEEGTGRIEGSQIPQSASLGFSRAYESDRRIGGSV